MKCRVRLVSGGDDMRPLFTALISATMILQLLPTGCGRDAPTGSNPEVPPTEFAYSPDDSLEAKLLALWCSGEILPPEGLVGEFLYELSSLRHAYRDSVPEIDELRFIPHWVHSRIIVQFDELTGPEVERGSYAGWDGLEERFQPSHVSDPFVGWFYAMGFREVMHSLRIAELYRGLPGVLSSQADAYGCRDVCPFTVYPALREDTRTYLFEDNRKGVRSIRYIYFRCGDEGPSLVGTWAPFGEEPVPDWWEEAVANMNEFCRN